MATKRQWYVYIFNWLSFNFDVVREFDNAFDSETIQNSTLLANIIFNVQNFNYL